MPYRLKIILKIYLTNLFYNDELNLNIYFHIKLKSYEIYFNETYYLLNVSCLLLLNYILISFKIYL